jgi:hypothetical protein
MLGLSSIVVYAVAYIAPHCALQSKAGFEGLGIVNVPWML